MNSTSVLIIDDDPHIARLLSTTLHSFGIYGIREIRTWDRARECIRACPCDLIFLDINLDDHTGWELLNEIKAHCPGSFITMFSGESTLENVRRAIREGAGAFVVKPFSYEKIEDVLKKFQAHTATRAGTPSEPTSEPTS
jgi:DNA-binding NtrC family response regulator